MTEKKGNTDATVMGLPEVEQTPDTTAPSLAPVPSPPVAPPPRTRTGGAIPQAAAPARRPSRVVKTLPADPKPSDLLLQDTEDAPATDPVRKVQTEIRRAPAASSATEEKEPPSMQKVAAIAGGVALLFVLTWLFWPSGAAKPRPAPRVEEPTPVVEAPPQPKPTPKPVVAAEPAKPKNPNPVFALDSTQHIVDPYGAHLEDQPLDPSHKYRLAIARDDSRLGTAMARFDEKKGWGAIRKMASHAAIEFGGAKALRLHCQPGTAFSEGQTFPIELSDQATRKKVSLPLDPAKHCWDFEVMREFPLGEGVKKRIRVPTDFTVKLGDNVPVKVVYVLELLGEKKEWRTGALLPGESVLAEGRSIRFGLLDPYAGDNSGSLELEVLSGDTQSSGLVTPTTETGVQFVPNK